MNSYVRRTLALIALVVTSGAASFAGSADRTTIEVPFAFTVGERTLPAGTYQVRPVSPTRVALVESEGGRATLISSLPAPAEVMQTRARLVFRRYGKQYFLAEVWAPERDRGHVLSASAGERSLRRALKETEDRLARGGSAREEITLAARR